jgi:competence protein ComEA
MPTFTLSRRRALIAVAVALAAVLGVSRLVSPPREATAPLSSVRPVVMTTSAVTVVDVAGAVRRPGVYRLSKGARVADAIERAGGPTRRADVALVNLAAPVADGQQIVVPRRPPGGVGGGTTTIGPGTAPVGPISLSSATVEQLDGLPGIGPVTAEKIVAYRAQHGPFTSVDQLDAIPGIGPARLENLKGLVIP